MFSIPYIAAPDQVGLEREPVAVAAGELHDRLDAALLQARSTTASGEQCACAEGLSVALKASTNGRIGSSWRRISAWPPPSITGSSAVTTNSPRVELALKLRHPRPPPIRTGPAGRGR